MSPSQLHAFGFMVLSLTTAASAVARQNPRPDEGSVEAAPPPSEKTGGSDIVVRTKGEVGAYADSDHVYVFTPALTASIENPSSGLKATGSYLVDVVSAASVDIVSTASQHWTETRQAAALSAGYNPHTVGLTAAVAASREPDYLSLTGGGVLSLEFAGKTVNPTFAYSYGHDTAGRSDTPFSIFSQPLARHTASAALELILDPETLISFNLDGIFEIGDQSKPYRMLPMFDAAVAPSVPAGASIDHVNAVRLPGRVGEHTPGTRNRYAFTTRVAQRLAGSTLVVSERLYGDDWGLKASTTDLRMEVDVSRRVFWWTHLRGHAQSGVSFWQRAYVASVSPEGPIRVPLLRTGDRELSPLQSATLGFGLRLNVGSAPWLEKWSIVAQVDGLLTHFTNTLYVVSREGALGVLELEAEF